MIPHRGKFGGGLLQNVAGILRHPHDKAQAETQTYPSQTLLPRHRFVPPPNEKNLETSTAAAFRKHSLNASSGQPSSFRFRSSAQKPRSSGRTRRTIKYRGAS